LSNFVHIHTNCHVKQNIIVIFEAFDSILRQKYL